MSAPPRAGLFDGAKIKVFELLRAWPERGIEFVIDRFAVVVARGFLAVKIRATMKVMYLAIDIGGTKTLIVLFSARGKQLKAVKFPTAQEERQFLADLLTALQSFRRRDVQQIVVAIPGVVQQDAEHKNYSFIFGNRPWQNLDLMTPIKNLFSCPCHFYNDANLATVYETRQLAGRSTYLTFSTGIGGGVAENGELLERLSNRFEPGHWQYVYAGERQEWEDIASARAISEHFQALATQIKGRQNYAEIAERLSLGLTDVILKYRPDQIVMGGPLAYLFPKLKRPLKKALRARLDRTPAGTYAVVPKLLQAEYPQESVVYGCLLVGRKLNADD